MPMIPQPRLEARLLITNALAVFDSHAPIPHRGDGLDVPRIAFTVTKTLDPTPNTAEIRIWNLSEITTDLIQGVVRKRISFSPVEQAALLAAGASAAPLQVTYDVMGIAAVTLMWGYAGGNPLLSNQPPLSIGFMGGSTNMALEPDGQSRVLVIRAEDGGVLMGAGRLQKFYKAGSYMIDVLADLINACALTVNKPQLEAAIQSSLLARGIPVNKLITLTGYNAATAPAADQIRSVMDGLGLRWSVQDGEFLLLDSNTVLAGYPPLLLSQTDNSLFGPPIRLEAGQMRAQTWANPECRPGRQAIVEAATLAAQYRIDKATTTGDTKEGGATEVTLDAIQTIPGVF